jgi:hypothetical protein
MFHPTASLTYVVFEDDPRRNALDLGRDRAKGKGVRLAKPNYQFEKRQRDLAKRRKQEEKRLRKQQRSQPQPSDAAPAEPQPDRPAGEDTPS